MAPGILYAGTRIKHPSRLSESKFNYWYNDVHVVDVLNSGTADLALRFQNLNPNAAGQFAAIYRMADMAGLETQAFRDIPKTSELLGGENDWRTETIPDIRAYELIQRFEGPNSKGQRCGAIVTVFMTPGEGKDQELDDWYRLQHLDMIGMCRGYIRSTRYKLMPGVEYNKREPGKEIPSYLAIHEYETTEQPVDQLKIVVGTEWSKKVIGESKAFDRHVWKTIYELGGEEEKKAGKVPQL